MEQKTKFQYSYFIYPYVIGAEKYEKYLARLLKKPNCKLKLFEKEKDYFCLWEVKIMIVYSPFWETLKKSSESTYTLINNYHISSSTIDKLRKNKPVTTTTLNDLCRILNCKLEEIAKYIPSDNDQPL